MKVENTTDYTSVARYYDLTRNIHPGMLEECFRRIFKQTGFPDRQTFLMLAAGPVSFPLP